MIKKINQHIAVTLPSELALGNDLVHVPTFEQSLNPLFIKKAYTNAEVDYCEQFDGKILRFASTWAAKEAVYKCLKQVNPDKISFKEIEIVRQQAAGKPTVVLPERFAQYKVGLSISHDGDYAWAIAFLG